MTGGAPRLVGTRGAERAGRPGVDEWIEADLEFPDGATGFAYCHMATEDRRMTFRVVGECGEMTALNYVLPHRRPDRRQHRGRVPDRGAGVAFFLHLSVGSGSCAPT